MKKAVCGGQKAEKDEVCGLNVKMAKLGGLKTEMAKATGLKAKMDAICS